MKRRDAIIALRGQADAVRALGATSLYLFGSTARDESGAGSDIDLFIEYDRSSRFSLVELVGIKQLLEGRLGASVDLDHPRQPGPPASGSNRGCGRARVLTERLVRPALFAILEAIEGVENASSR